MKLPQNTIWKQNNRSDILGDLWSTYNMDLTTKLGSMRVSPRMINLMNSSNNVGGNSTDLGIPCAVRYFVAGGFNYWAVCGSFVFNSIVGLETPFIKDVTANTPLLCDPNYSDIEILPDLGYMFVSELSTTLKYLKRSDGSWNSASGTLVDNAGLKAMAYFRGLNRIYIVDESSKSVSSVSNASTPAITAASSSTAYTLKNLVDGTINRISWIKTTSNRVWIGTINFSGQPANVYAWDGNIGAGGNYVPNEVYTLQASGSLSCVIEDDVPVILDTQGKLLKLNGGTFKELDRLPFLDQPPTTILVAGNATQRLCHYNGLDIIGGRINMLIRATLNVNGNYNKENLASGIWEYTQETGLYHKNSIGHTNPSGTIVDYGQQKILAVGCLKGLDIMVSVLGTVNGTYLVGAQYYITATSTLYAIFYDDKADTLQKAGSFTTSKIFSSNVTDIFSKIYAVFGRKFLNSGDKMVIKARISENEPVEATITYTSTTTFTVPTSSFSVAPADGDEVEILQGIGAGRTAHISGTPTSGGGSYTVTVDEVITGATTQTAIARFQTWKKLGAYNTQTDDFFKFPIDIGNESVWMQFKVWILWTGKDELHSVIISQSPNEKIE